jgi:hypothetical protein
VINGFGEAGGLAENPRKSLLSLAILERRWSVDGASMDAERARLDRAAGGAVPGFWEREWIWMNTRELVLTGDPWLGRGRWLVGLDPSSRERCPAWGASSERSLMGFRIVLEFHSSSW